MAYDVAYRFVYNDHKCCATVTRLDLNSTCYDTLEIAVLCTNIKTVIDRMITDARAYKQNKTVDTLTVFVADWSGSWSSSLKIAKRSFDRLYLPDETVSRVCTDLTSFYDNDAKYSRLSIPYKRNYLLYGPQGTGKTFFLKAIASKYDKSIGIINLSPWFTNESLLKAYRDFDADILVLEDFDQILNDSNTTFSCLLNSLDGFISKRGLVTFLTTNNLERFGEIITRPGRIDMIIGFEYADKSSIERMFANFYPDQIANFERFYEQLPDKMSIARLENFFTKHLDCEDICAFMRELKRDDLQDGKTRTLRNKFTCYPSVYN